MSRDEIDIDTRLRRALANAPDARIEPPAALDATIRTAARAAVRKPTAATAPSVRATWVERWRRWWAHPGFAPALAVAVVSTLVVTLWSGSHDKPLDDPREATRVAATRAAAAERNITFVPPAPAPAPIAAPIPAPAMTPELAQRKLEEDRRVAGQGADADADALRLRPATPWPEARDAAIRSQVADKPSPTQAPIQAPTQPRPAREGTVVAEAKARADALILRRESLLAKPQGSDSETAAAPTKAAEAMPTPATATAASTGLVPQEATKVTAATNAGGTTTPTPTPSADVAASPPSPPPSAPAAVAASSATSGVAPGVAAAKSAPQGGKLDATAPTVLGLAPSPAAGSSQDRRATVDGPPWMRTQAFDATWRWRRGAVEALQPFDDRLRGWIQRLMTHTQGRWVRTETVGVTAPSGARTDGRTTIELWQGESLSATILVGPSTAVWIDATGTTWQAPLPGDFEADLRRIFAAR